MNTLKIYPGKRLQFVEENSIYITENKIQSFNIIFPPTFGDYRTNELECEMRVYLSNDEYMSYKVSTASGKGEVPITNDITEKVQTVRIIFFFTKDGNVIGKTNAVEKQIEDAPYLGDPLTPRAEADEKIREQAATIAEQSRTIENQGETITQQGEQITELSGEVTELTTENTRLENQHETDLRYIDYLIDNPPEARLQPKSVTPSAQMQVVEPDEGYQGLLNVTVGATTPPRLQGKAVTPTNLMQNVQPDSGYDGLSNVAVAAVTAQELGFDYANLKKDVEFLGGVGTYDPFPEHSVGGIYITEVDEDGYPVKFLVKNFGKTVDTFPIIYQNNSIAKTRIKLFLFENCIDTNYLKVNNAVSGYFEGMTNINKIELPENLLKLDGYMFYNCISLKQIKIPASLSTIAGTAFNNCSALENVIIENGFNCDGLNLSASTLYSAETILSWFNALADRTGETAYTLTIGTTNLNKLTPEQKAIATNKNWNLA